MIRLPMMMAANHLIYTTPRGDMAELVSITEIITPDAATTAGGGDR